MVQKRSHNAPPIVRLLAFIPFMAAFAATLAWCLHHGPVAWNDSHANARVLSVAGIAFVAAFAVLRWRTGSVQWPWKWADAPSAKLPAKILITLLACTCLFGAFNYYKFRKDLFVTVGDYMDVTYYYTNSKYFDELGHFELYAALLIADREDQGRLKNIRRVRDLNTYEIVPVEKVLTPERIAEVKGRFTPERWEEFKGDVRFLTRQNTNYGWSYLMEDRGYNPPATWTLLGGALSNAVPIERMKNITMIDFALVCVMLLAIARAFGVVPMMFALLWFTCSFSGRWPMLGQALLRFDWSTALVMAICMLKLRHHAAAGALLTYSMLSRVFPMLFFFPYLAVMVCDSVRRKAIAKEHLWFVTGAGVAFVAIVGLTLLRLGPGSFVETVKNLSIHEKSFSSHRVGLGSALSYHGETKPVNIEQKRLYIESIKPYLKVTGLVMMGLIAVYIARKRPPAYETIMLAALPIFCVSNAQINYYNLRLALVVTHASDLRPLRNKVGLVLLFAIELLTQTVYLTGASRYAVTSLASWGMVGYFLVLIGFMAVGIVRPDYDKANPEPSETAPDRIAAPEPVKA